LIADVTDGELQETETPDAESSVDDLEEPSLDAIAQPEEEIA
jgi:hypothetical protein